MDFKLIRYPNKVATPGTLIVDGVRFSYTLEDIDREITADTCNIKVPGETCIPYGRYKVILSHSTHFNKVLPEILNVPCFEGIRIHGGNKTGDTLGCVLVGANTNHVDTISDCAGVLEQLVTAMSMVEDGEDIWIEITKEIA